MTTTEESLKGLARLREPFEPNLISKLPKGTKAQNECPPGEKVNCQVCGGWHHPKIKHLDYVGHAALTTRLLEADPLWTWEPVAFGPDGLPAFDKSGGLWIRLTVCGVTRLGYGHADPKGSHADAGAREKEVIGDALRNAGIRFGAALDLWHKGDLHAHEDPTDPEERRLLWIGERVAEISGAKNVGELKRLVAAFVAEARAGKDDEAAAKFQEAGDKLAAKAKANTNTQHGATA
ncbi:MAG: hypothetical protein V4792_09900 [Pseudomonadota bacterium]